MPPEIRRTFPRKRRRPAGSPFMTRLASFRADMERWKKEAEERRERERRQKKDQGNFHNDRQIPSLQALDCLFSDLLVLRRIFERDEEFTWEDWVEVHGKLFNEQLSTHSLARAMGCFAEGRRSIRNFLSRPLSGVLQLVDKGCKENPCIKFKTNPGARKSVDWTPGRPLQKAFVSWRFTVFKASQRAATLREWQVPPLHSSLLPTPPPSPRPLGPPPGFHVPPPPGFARWAEGTTPKVDLFETPPDTPRDSISSCSVVMSAEKGELSLPSMQPFYAVLLTLEKKYGQERTFEWAEVKREYEKLCGEPLTARVLGRLAGGCSRLGVMSFINGRLCKIVSMILARPPTNPLVRFRLQPLKGKRNAWCSWRIAMDYADFKISQGYIPARRLRAPPHRQDLPKGGSNSERIAEIHLRMKRHMERRKENTARGRKKRPRPTVARKKKMMKMDKAVNVHHA